jgi:glutamine synthetase
VNFRPGAPLAQADAVFRFKRVAREVAARHGFLASFAAKPFLDQPGTGMHWHFSVQRTAAAWPHLFAHEGGESSDELGHFIAGLQSHTPAAMAFFAPFDMAYDRIALSDASPSHASWGAEDRSFAFRIPSSGASARRVENRLPGGDANPYLTVAATLGLGLVGLRTARAPHPGADAAHALPRTLTTALDALADSTTLRELFGAPLVDAFVAIKRHEHAERAALADPRQQWDLHHLIELA